MGFNVYWLFFWWEGLKSKFLKKIDPLLQLNWRPKLNLIQWRLSISHWMPTNMDTKTSSSPCMKQPMMGNSFEHSNDPSIYTWRKGTILFGQNLGMGFRIQVSLLGSQLKLIILFINQSHSWIYRRVENNSRPPALIIISILIELRLKW